MSPHYLSRGEGPPRKNKIAPRLEPRGDKKGLIGLAFNRDDTTKFNLLGYAAPRRLHGKRLSARCLTEVTQ